MARGWESKSVESQQTSDDQGGAAAGRRGTAEDRERQRRRSGLELSRARVLSELEVTTAPARRTALESALAHLDGELAKLGPPPAE
jgi:hypothetical protein